MLGVSKSGLYDPFMSQCTVLLVDKPQDTTGNEPSGSDSLYVKYSDLRNESQNESRKRIGQSPPYEFIKIMIKEVEKPRPKQKP